MEMGLRWSAQGVLGGGGRVPGRKWSRNAAGRDFDSGRWGDQLATSSGWIGTRLSSRPPSFQL